MTASDEYDPKGKHRTSIRKMREFLDYITASDAVVTSVFAAGDGIALSIVASDQTEIDAEAEDEITMKKNGTAGACRRFEKLKIAIDYGADAVYFGAKLVCGPAPAILQRKKSVRERNTLTNEEKDLYDGKYLRS